MKLQFVDSIRGIAILLVILVHTAYFIGNLDFLTRFGSQYSQMGVQLFFVASAFTLCLSDKARDGESNPIFNYTVRRYFRIAPLYYLGILLYFFYASTLFKYTGDTESLNNYNLKNIIANVLFVHGFYPPANNIIVPGGWSIGTEMAFYIIFPFIFRIAKCKIKSYKNILQFVLLGFVISQLLVGIAICLGLAMGNNSFLYFNIINQLPCFFVGIGYYFYLNKEGRVYSWKYDFLGMFIFTLIAIFFWKLNINYLFSIIPFISSLSFVFLLEIFRKKADFNNKILMNIGQVSFSMYLFHFIFVYSLEYLPASIKDYGIISLSIIYVIIVSLTFLIGKVSFKLIEKPCINIGKQIILHKNSL